MYAIRSYYFGSELEQRIREAKARGVQVIVIDPRCTRTVKTLSTDWIQVYPGTDSALMLGVLYVLVDDRITSYNVCYTKLLRMRLESQPGVGSTFSFTLGFGVHGEAAEPPLPGQLNGLRA